MELLLVDLCKDTILKRPTPATTTTAGAVFDVPTFGLFNSKNRPNYTSCDGCVMHRAGIRDAGAPRARGSSGGCIRGPRTKTSYASWFLGKPAVQSS